MPHSEHIKVHVQAFELAITMDIHTQTIRLVGTWAGVTPADAERDARKDAMRAGKEALRRSALGNRRPKNIRILSVKRDPNLEMRAAILAAETLARASKGA